MLASLIAIFALANRRHDRCRQFVPGNRYLPVATHSYTTACAGGRVACGWNLGTKRTCRDVRLDSAFGLNRKSDSGAVRPVLTDPQRTCCAADTPGNKRVNRFCLARNTSERYFFEQPFAEFVIGSKRNRRHCCPCSVEAAPTVGAVPAEPLP